jgi:hypothetical protein
MVSKLDVFIIVTILFFSDVYMNGVNGGQVNVWALFVRIA